MAEVDLEALAAGYAHRSASPESLRRAAAAWRASGGAAGDPAVDVGGGLGQQAEQWAKGGALAVVVDPAQGMVAAAARRSGVEAVRARAEALPLGDGTAVLVSFSWSLHHTRWERALAEAARVLQDGGRLEIANPGPGDMARSHMARWFPSMAAIDAARFPDPDEVAGAFAGVGLELVAREEAVEAKRRRACDWTAAVEAGFVSTLQLLPVGEVAGGLASFRERYPDPDQIVEYEVRYQHLAAIRRSLA